MFVKAHIEIPIEVEPTSENLLEAIKDFFIKQARLLQTPLSEGGRVVPDGLVGFSEESLKKIVQAEFIQIVDFRTDRDRLRTRSIEEQKMSERKFQLFKLEDDTWAYVVRTKDHLITLRKFLNIRENPKRVFVSPDFPLLHEVVKSKDHESFEDFLKEECSVISSTEKTINVPGSQQNLWWEIIFKPIPPVHFKIHSKNAFDKICHFLRHKSPEFLTYREIHLSPTDDYYRRIKGAYSGGDLFKPWVNYLHEVGFNVIDVSPKSEEYPFRVRVYL